MTIVFLTGINDPHSYNQQDDGSLTNYYLLDKGGYVFSNVGLTFCLFVSNITQKSYERIVMKFYGGVQGRTIKN